MTWVVHSAWLERQHDGTANYDLDGAGANTINLGIVTESSINPDTDSLYTGLTAVSTGTAWTGPVALANVSCGLVSGNLVFDADDIATIAQDGSGFADGRTVVAYFTSDNYIIASSIAAAVFGNAAAALTISLDAAGIWTMNI